jgi:ABC-type transport system substrate-binding protein
LHGTQRATYQIIPGNISGYNKGFISNKSWSPHYDLKRAKAELKKCPSGLHNLVIPYQHTSVDVDNEYNAVAHMINSLGPKVHATLKPMTFDAWLGVVVNDLDKTTIGKVDLTENLWQQDYPDAQDYMTNLLRFGANYDIGGFNNPAFNRLADQAEVTFNKSKRNSLYLQASKIALNAGAWIAIGNAVVPTLVNPKVHGLVGAPSIGIVWAKNSDWSKVSIS